jgi:UDP-glucose 4-epimerase
VRRVCVTGGAGFIGSNLAERLSVGGAEVVIFDNFRTGRREFVADILTRGAVRLVEGDVLDVAALKDAIEGCDWVFHMQANADVRRGPEHPRRDLEQNVIATSSVLEAMRACGVKRIAFASTGAVYGEPEVFPTPEDTHFPIQTSLYGASKLAGEALVEAYAASYGFTGIIYRLVSILGERYTHGHLFDFYHSLKDCLDAMLLAAKRHCDEPGAHIYNVGADETLRVEESVRILTAHLSLAPRIEYAGGRRGWIGDSPLIHLDTARIRALGWRPRLTIERAAVRTLEWFDANEYLWGRSASRERVA